MTAEVSVIIPTCGREEMLRGALRRILACDPPPSEILVQIDASDKGTAAMREREFAGLVSCEQNTKTLGPGGGRNLLIRRAKHPLVASFDDDSWPEEQDFFARVVDVAKHHPKAAVLACCVREKEAPEEKREKSARDLANFGSGGCVFRAEAFLQTAGFVPLRRAYGMEEVDLALQLLDRNWCIRYSPELRVYHDSDLQHHATASVNAAHITNTGLLAFLRYPPRFWLLGMRQVANRVRYAMRMRRFAGILSGVLRIPAACWRYRGYRKVVRPETVGVARRLR